MAGQLVQCPECQRSLKAPAAVQLPLRTSGFAIASVICALLLGLTFVGPGLAIVFGVVALVSIGRHRDRLTGAGYAVFGIVAGLLFLGLSVLAFFNAEFFVGLRTQLLLGKIDTSGPMEVVLANQGFAITRPTPHWGVAGPELTRNLGGNFALILVEPGKDSYLGVQAIGAQWLSARQYREQVIHQFEQEAQPNWQQSGQVQRLRGLQVRLLRTVQPPGPQGAAFRKAEEAVLDVRVLGQPLTYLIRVVKEVKNGRLYLLRAWCQRRRYEQMEPVFVQAMDSFRAVSQH
ncbi:MAG TPA: DUF4190 domain-containing protein [Gemmataceae bacterium]|nr:DUF4190 domain-containing protein [Gemmataceae bacterium]